MSVFREEAVLRVTHPLELLRQVVHGSDAEAASARAEYDRRIATSPEESAGLKVLRSSYLIATTHAYAATHATLQVAAEKLTRCASWFGAPGDVPLKE